MKVDEDDLPKDTHRISIPVMRKNPSMGSQANGLNHGARDSLDFDSIFFIGYSEHDTEDNSAYLGLDLGDEIEVRCPKVLQSLQNPSPSKSLKQGETAEMKL